MSPRKTPNQFDLPDETSSIPVDVGKKLDDKVIVEKSTNEMHNLILQVEPEDNDRGKASEMVMVHANHVELDFNNIERVRAVFALLSQHVFFRRFKKELDKISRLPWPLGTAKKASLLCLKQGRTLAMLLGCQEDGYHRQYIFPNHPEFVNPEKYLKNRLDRRVYVEHYRLASSLLNLHQNQLLTPRSKVDIIKEVNRYFDQYNAILAIIASQTSYRADELGESMDNQQGNAVEKNEIVADKPNQGDDSLDFVELKKVLGILLSIWLADFEYELHKMRDSLLKSTDDMAAACLEQGKEIQKWLINGWDKESFDDTLDSVKQYAGMRKTGQICKKFSNEQMICLFLKEISLELQAIHADHQSKKLSKEEIISRFFNLINQQAFFKESAKIYQ